MTSPRAERGFTLIEILVVLAILGLVAGLVVSRGPARSAALEMRQATSLVAGTLRVARTRAIAINRPVAVLFDAAHATLQLGTDDAHRLPAGIALARGPTAIIFRPDGSSSGGRVDLASASRTEQVAVDWLTGRVVTAAGP